jgi:hypothetical protein
MAALDAESDLLTLADKRFGPLSEAERKLLRAAPAGDWAHCEPDGAGRDAPEIDPANADTWAQDRRIRTALLQWLCVDRTAREQVHPAGIRVISARMEGLLDLSFVAVPFPLTCTACWWPQGLELSGTVLPELDLRKCWIGPLPPPPAGAGGGAALVTSGLAVMARGMQVRGSIFLRDNFHAEGAVYLYGAEIGGNLECDGGSLKNSNATALQATRAKIGGNVLMRNKFWAEGEVNLYGAEVGGNLSCIGGSFKNGEGRALVAVVAKIGGGILLRGNFPAEGEVNRFHAEGEVNLYGAQIGANLECDRASFKNKKGFALTMEGAKIAGDVLLRDTFNAEGEVRLYAAEIGGNLDCNGSILKNGKLAALNAVGARIGGNAFLGSGFEAEGQIAFRAANIGGDLIIGGNPALGGANLATGAQLHTQSAEIKGTLNVVSMRTGAETVVDLSDASCNVLKDRSESWPPAGNLILDGFVYRRVADPWDAKSRLDWLRRQLPPARKDQRGKFRPQPYRQLAGVLRAEGRDAEAKDILIGMAKDRRKWADLRCHSRFWQWVLWKIIRNGHQPLRAFVWLLVFWVAGFLLFGWGYQAQAMLPSDRFAYDDLAHGKPLPGQYDPFCALVYAIDTSLPIISFGQRERWHPRAAPTPDAAIAQPETHEWAYRFFCEASFTRHLDPRGHWIAPATLATVLEVYRWIHLAAGWFLATMLLAGISGLVGRE